ncbi:OmpP1/FadL family transporter [Dichotomicrobium thermohalophilum]|uniref:Long-chain fatty acid transport protein n=1 Tax=Dichotomicrobium thermohalophilum TaxID=933063 RepID=A0A397Q3A1_9HYPH|nr:OmpP1/FadL family transporter [Dichotomicrobium thermohalophilum]RIA55518.1 long-chain fatty acid transport protein [Dichotomicrobium thermohalophilum]
MPGGNAFKRWSVAGAALCAGLVASTSAHAGAFAIREQSSYYQGMSFAGAAAGDDLSAMFWNSAAAASAPGINVSAHAALVVPHREIEATGGALAAALEDDSGEIGDPTFVPATYANYQVSERLFLGVGLNSGYGFNTKPDNEDWAGSALAITSEVFSVNLNPNLAYQVTDELTVGVGAQVQYFDVRLRSGPATITDSSGAVIDTLPGRETEGDDWGVGATAGVIWNPMPGTRLGVGFRSAIEVELDGTCEGAGLSTFKAQGGASAISSSPGTGSLAACDAQSPDVTADLTLPELVTVGLSHQVSDRWRVLGTVEWSNWSRLGTVQIVNDESGEPVDALPLNYDDGWFFSGGVEYAYSPSTILRTGIGYEISPIYDETRDVLLPDNDRLWLSAGFSTKLSESTKLDFGYSHLFIEDGPVCEAEPDCGTLEAEGTGDIDIVTLGLTHNFGGPEPELEPLK